MKDINTILPKHFLGTTSAEEEAFVAEWKAAHAAEYSVMQAAWKEEVNATTFKTYDTKAAWNKIQPDLDLPKGKVVQMNNSLKYLRIAVAAALAVVLGVTAVLMYFGEADNITVLAEGNAPEEVALPDGSTVWLAPGSTLEYASAFSENRDLALDGTAFFEVAKDPEHPFTVKATHCEVRVLGTAFNIENRAGASIVSVEHGKVAVTNDLDSVVLLKGEAATVLANGDLKMSANNSNYLSWRDGAFAFNSTPLQEVVGLLNGFYPEEVQLASSADAACLVTGNFAKQELDDILQIIALTCGVESTTKDNIIILK